MSIARHHIEWLQLIEASGPFLSLPVLLRVFPQGLDPHDARHFSRLKAAHEEWLDNWHGPSPDSRIHREWVRFVIAETLGWSEDRLGDPLIAEDDDIPSEIRADIPEHGETVRPDMAIFAPGGGRSAGAAVLLIKIEPSTQALQKAVPGSGWSASPDTRMMELLRGTDIDLGLVVNGHHWMLVHGPPGETVSYITWDAAIWIDEPITLRAFQSLLSPHRFFGVPESDTLTALFAESAANQKEVTDQLGFQVRKAVEVLIQAMDRVDRNQGGVPLAGYDESHIYAAALTVMMRLVFLFSADERGLLLFDDEPLYNQYYSVTSLRGQLQEAADQHGEEVLEYRNDAWYRLLATFRAVHGGIHHDRLSLPAYGGHLFDPDRYPFLEGRAPSTTWRDTPASPPPISNRTVLHLLTALQVLREKFPGGQPEARRLSFRALDIEQIGHVYEGLLDHTAVRATEPVLGLKGAKDKEPEIPLSVLEQKQAAGTEELVNYLKKATGRSVPALRRAVTEPPDGDEDRLRVACHNDDGLNDRVRPFAALLRADTSGYPVVITTGGIYVSIGTDRRTSGTHYTPKRLTEPIVQHTLEPLVYDGPADGKPRDQWRLRSAKAILDLKVCDMAMGSGAFLVQSCRYLARRLTEAWDEAERTADGRLVTALDGTLSKDDAESADPLPRDPDERYSVALRTVAERCLYGVDKNPMAVEMAKLSLWLVTMAKGRPFTFLDHALKSGDSLLGVNRPQLKNWSASGRGDDGGFKPMQKEINDAIIHRKALERVRTIDIHDVERKAHLHRKAEERIGRLKLAGDLIVAPYLMEGSQTEKEEKRLEFYNWFVMVQKTWIEKELRQNAEEILEGRSTFHWPLEFPEIFLDDHRRDGFDAIIGNPPFQGGQKITGALGTPYRNYLVDVIAGGKRGSADLCAYFFLRAVEMMRDGGMFGLLATNTIAQGDTREVGLDQVMEGGNSIARAVKSMKWPGTASLEVSVVWGGKGPWKGRFVLEDEPVRSITPYLSKPGAVAGKPYRLKANEGRSFIGSYVLGMGFVMSPEEARSLIDKDPKNREVLLPYLNGEDLNSHPEQAPSRWVINFFDWPLNRAAEGSWKSANEKQRKAWLRKGVVPEDYPHPVAADYPDCLEIVELKVKPERMRIKYSKIAREKWWLFERVRPELYNTIKNKSKVLITAQTSRRWEPCFVELNKTYSHTTVVFALQGFSYYAVMQSFTHEEWRLEHGPSLRMDARYTPSDCFETFPFPESTSSLESIGRQYHDHRQSIMKTRWEGLTATYNRFHNPDEASPDIQKLRDLHVQMDNAVARAYGWSDLGLDHDFHETQQGIRFTISETARREVLDRLLRLNHERYAEEVAQGLHQTGKKKSPKKKKLKKEKREDQLEIFRDQP